MKTLHGVSYSEYLREQKGHTLTKRRTVVKDRKGYHRSMLQAFPGMGTVLCVGARDLSEVQFFLDNGHPDSMGIDLFTDDPTTIVEGDMHELWEHFPTGMFDVGFLCHSLEHSLTPTRLLRGLRHVCRRGVFIVLPKEQCSPSLKHPLATQLLDPQGLLQPHFLDNMMRALDLQGPGQVIDLSVDPDRNEISYGYSFTSPGSDIVSQAGMLHGEIP